MASSEQRNTRRTDDDTSFCVAHLHTERNNAKNIETLFSKVNSMKDKMQEIEIDLAKQKERQVHVDKSLSGIQESISDLATIVHNNSKDLSKMMVIFGIIMSACTAGLVKLLQGI